MLARLYLILYQCVSFSKLDEQNEILEKMIVSNYVTVLKYELRVRVPLSHRVH